MKYYEVRFYNGGLTIHKAVISAYSKEEARKVIDNIYEGHGDIVQIKEVESDIVTQAKRIYDNIAHWDRDDYVIQDVITSITDKPLDVISYLLDMIDDLQA